MNGSLNRRLAVVSGALAPVVALGSILLGTDLSPTFSWTGSALSDLGVTPASALVFNRGLVAGGVLALPLVWVLAADGRSTLGVVFGLTAVSMALVGVFRSGHPLHFPVALGFYLGATATMLVDGIEALRTNVRAWGLAAVGLALVHIGSWAAWSAGIRPGPGLAIPEAIGAALFALWVWGVALQLHSSETRA
ncbi:DUF998 domain-containing protein [Halococcus saccharolyticus]|uniref:DUF998 domain-containing protein n=1 Tax=Halococcus saccharolyticus DSM 5350 TaxID=1227455 RepID=M0MI39_9EURY|nr:DUF998 domain-containing protein [Halococcus saccharolyticus]EMA45387.1 hypothetical protein C449_07170 [Halococcus saccharolyticus DSM 5350]